MNKEIVVGAFKIDPQNDLYSEVWENRYRESAKHYVIYTFALIKITHKKNFLAL